MNTITTYRLTMKMRATVLTLIIHTVIYRLTHGFWGDVAIYPRLVNYSAQADPEGGIYHIAGNFCA